MILFDAVIVSSFLSSCLILHDIDDKLFSCYEYSHGYILKQMLYLLIYYRLLTRVLDAPF